MQNTDNLMNLSPIKLYENLMEQTEMKLPEFISDTEDMQTAGILLGKCASLYSYLSNMALIAKLKKRELKRSGASKQEVEDALSKEEIFSSFADNMKTTYNAISRMITVKQQINEELKMSDSK